MKNYRTEMAKWHLTVEQCGLIMDNCVSNVFATDGVGHILYANEGSLAVLGMSADEARGKDIYQLVEEGYTSRSLTDEALRSGGRQLGTYTNKAGKVVAAASTPVYGDDGNIVMVVTYNGEMTVLEAFQEELRETQQKAAQFKAVQDFLDKSSGAMSQFVVRDPTMCYIFDTLQGGLAKSDSTIMLYGESGVGKEVVANFIRQHSQRRDEVYIPVNCAAIPTELIESELFGYEKGAFTGANKEGKPGLFELADGGTLFMDELGELPLMVQSKLLRVLESGEIRRVGGGQTRRVDVRIIAATNRDLKAMVAQKEFRDDLYYRLNVVPVVIPALRDRPMDLEALAALFLKTYNRKHSRQRTIPQEMWEQMRRYPWPGNIRELRNVIERYVLTGDGRMAFPEDLRPEQEDIPPKTPAEASMTQVDAPSGPLRDVMGSFEREYIHGVLARFQGDVTAAAGYLGIHRSVLYKKLKKWSGET